MNYKLKIEKGYTSVELMIAVVLSLMLIGFIYSAYFFSIRITRSWREKINLEDTAMICLNRISLDLVNCSEIFQMNKNGLKLLLNNKKTINYDFGGGNLFRNGIRMNDHGFNIIDLSFAYTIPDEIQKDLDNDWENESSDDIFRNKIVLQNPLITVKMFIGDSKKQMELRSAIHPRNLNKSVFKGL
jgi:hypothetical protein